MYPQHPYIDPNPWAVGPLERESAYRAQQAADFLGYDRVNHELLEAQRMGGDRMAQEAAMQLQSEAFIVQDMQRRQIEEAAYYAHSSPAAPTTKAATVPTNQTQSSGSKPAPTPQTAPAPRLVSTPPDPPSWEDILDDPRLVEALNRPGIASTASSASEEDPFWKEGGGFEILLYISTGIMVGFGLAWLFIAIAR